MINKFIRSSAIYVVLGFLPLAVNFLLSPLYSRVLAPEQNALITQAAVFQSFSAIFMSLCIDGAYSRLYFDYYKDPKKLKEFTSTILIFVFLLNLIFFIGLFFSGDYFFSFLQKNKSFTYTKYGTWAFISSFCGIIQAIVLAYYRNEEKVMRFSVVSLAYFFASVALILTGLLVFKKEAYGSITGRAIGYLLCTVILLIIFLVKNGINFRFKYIRESLTYSLPLVPYLLMMALYGNIDRILIERYFSLKDLGIYSFAFLMSGAVSVFISAGQNVIAPAVYRLLGEEKINVKKVNTLFRWFHFLNTAIISLGLAAAIVFIEIFIDPQYHAIENYIGVLFLAFIFRVYYLIYVDALFYFKKTKWIFLITLGSFLVGLLSNFILMPRFGILGVGISVMIINLAQTAGAYLQVKLYKLNTAYYQLTQNHIYTLLVIAAYFVSLFISRSLGISVIPANFAPAIITILFSAFFLYKNRQAMKDFLNTRLKAPRFFRSVKDGDQEI